MNKTHKNIHNNNYKIDTNILKNLDETDRNCIIFYMIGDLIGFNNGQYYDYLIGSNTQEDLVIEFVSKFISNGGINSLNIQNLRISSATIVNNTFFNILMSSNNFSIKNIITKLKDFSDSIVNRHNYLYINDKEYKQKQDSFEIASSDIPNFITDYNVLFVYIKKILKYNEDTNSVYESYDKHGNFTCFSHSICIGLLHKNDSELDKLIEHSITISKITHVNPMGFLSSLSISYFVYLAIKKVDIKEWINLLYDLIKSDKIKKYINMSNKIVSTDYLEFEYSLLNYKNIRFSDDKLIKYEINDNLIYKSKFYSSLLIELNKSQIQLNSYLNCYISLSMLFVIYDSLLECSGKYEKLVFYCMLNNIFSNYTGSIASALFYLVYGKSDIPTYLFEYVIKNNLL